VGKQVVSTSFQHSDEGAIMPRGRPKKSTGDAPSAKTAKVVLCQEGVRAPCCMRDEGRPFGAAL